MSLTGNNAIVGSGYPGNQPFSIEQSLRFNDGDSAYLEKTFSGVGTGTGSRWTFSCFVKRGNIGTEQVLIGAGVSSTGRAIVYFNSSDNLVLQIIDSGITRSHLVTSQVFRDVGSWYHIVAVQAEPDATSTDRVRLYVNGSRLTDFTTETYSAGSAGSYIPNAWTHRIGSLPYSVSSLFDGYLAEIHLIAGQSLDPSYFGETDSSTNQWVPKFYVGTYGTNGFYLPFSNGTSWSNYFDFSGDYIRVPSNSGAPFDFGTGNFTVEGWFYLTTSGSWTSYWGISEGGGASQKINLYDSTGNGTLDVDINGSVVFSSSAVLTDLQNKWAHIALVREGTGTNQTKLYVNGSVVGQGTVSANFSGFTQPFTVGHNGELYSGAFKGYISNFRVVKGTAVYTGSFTPPTSDLTAISGTQLLTCQNSTFVDNSANNLTVTVSGDTRTEKFSPISLDFTDDHSGNGNNFTPTNLTYSDVVLDSPKNNFCTINYIHNDYSSSWTLSEGNLKFTASGDTVKKGTMLLPKSGKWYFEVKIDNNTIPYMGVVSDWIPLPSYNVQRGTFLYVNNGLNATYVGYDGGNLIGYSNTSTGSIIGIAHDSSTGETKYYRDNSLLRTVTTAFSSDDFTFFIAHGSSGGTGGLSVNFGQDSSFAGTKTAQNNTDDNGIGDFYYTPPSGYLALCTANLPDPSIALPGDHFNTVLYTGNGSTQSITGVGFQPNLNWIKARNSPEYHVLHDVLRGANNRLFSNTTDAETTAPTMTSFDSDGFSVSTDGGTYSSTNANGTTYAAWNWKGTGGAAPSKTYTVTVTNPGSGNRYTLDGRVSGTNAIPITLEEGGTYTFDQSDSSNSGHPLRFSTTSNGTHGGGSEYTTGVTTNGTPGSAGAYTRITVAASAPTLYYYCTAHSDMGAEITTPGVGGGVSSLDGTIASVVNANTTAGFSIVSYTGTGVAGDTMGHGLSQTPEVVIMKKRASNGADGVRNWTVWHKDLTDGNYLYLSTDNAQFAGRFFGEVGNGTYPYTEPTASLITFGGVNTGQYQEVNYNGDDYIMYCFHSVEGYSKIGSYTGNGNADGAFVYTGFRPAFVLFKLASLSGDSWTIIDNKRDTYNQSYKALFPNLTSSENTVTNNHCDFVSNGIKIRNNLSRLNAVSQTYIYMAFAENPVKYSNAR